MPHALAVYVAPRPECPGLPNRFAVYVAPRPGGPHSGEAHLHRRTRVVVGKLAGSIAASLWALALPRRCRCLSPPPCPAPCPNCRAHSTRVVWGASHVPPRAAAIFTIVPALSDCRTRMFSNEGACGSKTWRQGPRPVRSLAPFRGAHLKRRGTARDDALWATLC
jgi:hypothetical protein